MRNKARNAREILTFARLLIKDVGWCQGRSYVIKPGTDDIGAYCAMGALVAAASDANWAELGYYFKAVKTLKSVVDSDKNIGIMAWNDDPMRTKAHVLAAFNKAIRKAKGR